MKDWMNSAMSYDLMCDVAELIAISKQWAKGWGTVGQLEQLIALLYSIDLHLSRDFVNEPEPNSPVARIRVIIEKLQDIVDPLVELMKSSESRLNMKGVTCNDKDLRAIRALAREMMFTLLPQPSSLQT
jgi:hypothetical protein